MELAASTSQKFFAGNWPLRILLILGPIVAVGWTTSLVLPGMTLTLISIVWFSFLTLVAALLGFMAAVLVAGYILHPLYYVAAGLNGAPYTIGEHVIILAPRHRGKVVKIYEIWGERQEVRVELTDLEREKCTDVFSYFEVCRHTGNLRLKP
jgi:hypothetical protein